jgi:hypothetical protein
LESSKPAWAIYILRPPSLPKKRKNGSTYSASPMRLGWVTLWWAARRWSELARSLGSKHSTLSPPISIGVTVESGKEQKGQLYQHCVET